MKSIVPVGSWIALLGFALAGCEPPKGSTEEGAEPAKPAEAAHEPAGSSGKLRLGPQSPTPPIEPSPVPSLPANVKEGMERKDSEPGMPSPAQAPDPKPATRSDAPAPKDGPRGDAPK